MTGGEWARESPSNPAIRQERYGCRARRRGQQWACRVRRRVALGRPISGQPPATRCADLDEAPSAIAAAGSIADDPLGQESAQRVVERRHQAGALAGEDAMARPRRDLAERGTAARLERRRRDAGELGRARRELGPADVADIGEMPEARLAVDQEIEADVDEVGNVGRRNANVARRAEDLATLQRAEGMEDEVVPVPRTEERARSHDERTAGSAPAPRARPPPCWRRRR